MVFTEENSIYLEIHMDSNFETSEDLDSSGKILLTTFNRYAILFLASKTLTNFFRYCHNTNKG